MHLLDLRQDLALPHDQAVQAARDAQQVARRVAVAQQEQVRAQLLKRHAAGAAHPLLHLAHACGGKQGGEAWRGGAGGLGEPAGG